jgi:hypothetical protein
MGTIDNIMISNHKGPYLRYYGEVLHIEGDQERRSGGRKT